MLIPHRIPRTISKNRYRYCTIVIVVCLYIIAYDTCTCNFFSGMFRVVRQPSPLVHTKYLESVLVIIALMYSSTSFRENIGLLPFCLRSHTENMIHYKAAFDSGFENYQA